MKCKNCLVKLPEDSLFCTKCGHILLSKENTNLEAKADYLSTAKFEEINVIK